MRQSRLNRSIHRWNDGMMVMMCCMLSIINCDHHHHAHKNDKIVVLKSPSLLFISSSSSSSFSSSSLSSSSLASLELHHDDEQKKHLIMENNRTTATTTTRNSLFKPSSFSGKHLKHHLTKRSSSQHFDELLFSVKSQHWASFVVPYFIEEPQGDVTISNLYGHILPCGIKFRKLYPSQEASGNGGEDPNSSLSSSIINDETIDDWPTLSAVAKRIFWEVRDSRSLDEINHYVPVMDVPGIREQRLDGSLSFMPFGSDSLLFQSSSTASASSATTTSTTTTTIPTSELHNAMYRCVVELAGIGRLISRSVLVNVVSEENIAESAINSPSVVIRQQQANEKVRAFDTVVSEGNDALLKCLPPSELYQVIAWLTDDEDIILPFQSSNNQYIPVDTRYYVLPSGELLVASVHGTDFRRQFRCRVAHRLTGKRLDSSNWARIKLSDQPSHLSYRPRFNLNASLRQTLTIQDEHDDQHPFNHHQQSQILPPIDLYCSFDGQPPPNISWYFISYQNQQIFKQHAENLSQLQPLSNSIESSSNYLITTRHLRVNQPTLRDLGTYVCVANNTNFEVRHETDLLSQRLMRLNLTLDRLGPFLPGESVTLSCNLTANFFDFSTIMLDKTSEMSFKKNFEKLDESAGQLGPILSSRLALSYFWYHNHQPIATTHDHHYHHSQQQNSGFNSHHSYHAQGERKVSRDRKQQSKPQASRFRQNGSGGTTSQATSSNILHRYEMLAPNVLRITELDYQDSGIYQCFVRTTGGPDFEQWFQTGTVISLRQTAPTFISTFNEQILLPSIASSSSSSSGNKNNYMNDLSLKCIAIGIPAPIIIWQRNSINLTDYTGNLLNLPYSPAISFNNDNNQQSQQHHYHHSQQGTLFRYKTSTFQFRSSNVLDGTGAAQSTNRVTSKPKENMKPWQTVSYFNISSLRTQDAGTFSCIAFNRAGSIIHQARIGVIGPPLVQPISDQTAVLGEMLTITCSYSGYPIEEVFFTRSKNRISFDERHTISQMGTINIGPIEKSDEGDYSCVVLGTGNSENAISQRAEQSFRIMVISPPVLSPFLFSDALEEGTRATAVCSVISGDPPITLQWLKDGQPLMMAHTRIDPNVQVLNIKEFISSLIITNVTRRHQGLYTCLATTPNTRSNRTAMLRVKAPPKWLIKPADKVAIYYQQQQISSLSLILNESPVQSPSSFKSFYPNLFVRFDCLASGNPTPVIRWKFLRPKPHSANLIENQETESVPILSSPQIHVLENGSLLIRAIDKTKFEGVYLCEISNGVGKALEARAKLTIHQTPQIQVKVTTHSDSAPNTQSPNSPKTTSDHDHVIQLALRRHSQVSLSCTGTGSVPLFISWYKNGREINIYDTGSITSTNSFRIFEKTGNSRPLDSFDSKQFGERTSNLILKHLARHDTGRYVCLCRNTFGLVYRTVLLKVLEPPSPPEALKALEVGSRTVTLTWSIAYTGNLPLLSQNIEYRKEADKTWHNALMIKSNTNTVTVHGLQTLTSYEFRVSFHNELGSSDHSRSITLTTQMEAPTAMPDNVRAIPLSTHSIRLTWSVRMPSIIDSSASEIEIIDGYYIGYRPLPSLSTEVNKKLVDGHQSSFTYKTISNVPIQNSQLALSNNWKIHHRAKFSQKTPANESFGASFQMKSPLNNQSSSMLLLDQTNELDNDVNNHLNLPSSSQKNFYYEHIIDALQRQTQYQFIVQAFNEKGTGPSSIEVTARTFTHDPPRAPSFRIKNVSAHDALLSWDYDEPPLSSASIEANLLDVTGNSVSPLLVDGYVISYRFALKINQNQEENSVDDGEWQSITISTASTMSFTLRNLRCGSDYIVKIEAFNEMGSGQSSDPIHFSTLGGVPIPPDKHSASGFTTIDTGSNEFQSFIISNITFVTINFDLWSDGGCPINGYSIKYRSRRLSSNIIHAKSFHNHNRQNNLAMSPEKWITLSTHLIPKKDRLVIRDLQPGTWHDLIIVAQNDAGKREAEFSFATLTFNGATVEPLHAFESRMASTFSSSSGTFFGVLFDDPMIFIPALCTVLVLLVVTSTSIFLYVMRVRQESMHHLEDSTYCTHRSSTRSDEMSLNSYANSNGTKKSPLNQIVKMVPSSKAKQKPMEKESVPTSGLLMMKTEPLYDRSMVLGSSNTATTTTNSTIIDSTTTNFCSPTTQTLLAYVKSPKHQQCSMKKISNESFLGDLNQEQNESYSFEPIFDHHHNPAMNHSYLQLSMNNSGGQSLSGSATSSGHSSHLYQMPEQCKKDAMLTIKCSDYSHNPNETMQDLFHHAHSFQPEISGNTIQQCLLTSNKTNQLTNNIGSSYTMTTFRHLPSNS